MIDVSYDFTYELEGVGDLQEYGLNETVEEFLDFRANLAHRHLYHSSLQFSCYKHKMQVTILNTEITILIEKEDIILILKALDALDRLNQALDAITGSGLDYDPY